LNPVKLNMLQLFWTPLAINFFIEWLMVSLLTGYFAVRLANAFRLQVNVKIAFFLLLTFGSASCGTLLQFLGIALHPDYAEFALPFVSVFGALAMSDRKSTRLNSSHNSESRMPSSA
jgi:hypothetical protein